MINKITYISDFFIEDFQGGAELSDNVLIQFLKENNIEIEKIKCSKFDFNSTNTKSYIISNFVSLSEKNKNLLIKGEAPYIIIERDQKYVRSRNTVEYPDFIAPQSEVINRDFYAAASIVFCLTSKQMEIMNEHLNLNNLKNLGCTQFSIEQLKILSDNINTQKNEKYVVIKGKRWDKAKAICNQNGLQYDVLEKQDYEIFINNLSKYKGIVFFSHAFESCCRLLIEARILNLSILTDNRNGCTYEDWFKEHKGRDLLDFVENKTKETMMTIMEELLK